MVEVVGVVGAGEGVGAGVVGWEVGWGLGGGGGGVEPVAMKFATACAKGKRREEAEFACIYIWGGVWNQWP